MAFVMAAGARTPAASQSAADKGESRSRTKEDSRTERLGDLPDRGYLSQYLING